MPRIIAFPGRPKDFAQALSDIAKEDFDTLILGSTGSRGGEVLATYTEQELIELCKAIKSNGGKIKKLEMACIDIGPHGAEIIARELEDIKGLENLQLYWMNVNDKALEALLGISCLKELRLEHNLITDVGAKILASSKLEKLFLSANYISKKGAELLAKNPHLAYVDLSASFAADEEVSPQNISTDIFRGTGNWKECPPGSLRSLSCIFRRSNSPTLNSKNDETQIVQQTNQVSVSNPH